MPWINLAESLAVFFIISLAFYIAIPVKTPQTLKIPGGNMRAIITHLTQKGIDLTPIDTYILRYIGTPKKGWIHLGKKEMNRIDFLHALTDPKTHIDKITLIPGETLSVFFRTLQKRYELNATKLADAYQKASPYPEAGILADTYFVPRGIKEKPLVDFLVRSSERRYKAMSQKAFGDYNTTRWQRILIVASIIQKEAANRKEMPLIASVIYNRLKKRMRLQMDGTLNYGIYSHVKVTPRRIREDNTTFNTYKHRGLPASPVGSVEKAAIDAALHPAKTDYLYFFRNKRTGRHDFAENFKAHRKNIKKAKAKAIKN
jgi:UPF0755 protein